MARIELTLTSKSRDLGDEMYDEIYDQTVNGLEIYPKSSGEQAPIPWDATLYIEGENLVMEGYVGPGGPSSGTCVVKIPLTKVMNFIGISVTVEDEQTEEDLRAMFDKYGWL